MLKGMVKMLKWLWRVPVKRKIDKIIIHCSATPPSMDIDAKEIDRWHRNKGWSQIGYHFVIKRDGEIQDGRPLELIGAHVKGYNTGSIGICLVGGVEEGNVSHAQDNFTDKQWRSLRNLLKICKADYKKATIHGHNEYANKACPSHLMFNMN
jgi:N-acetylmuramoyl-L-alanine amidase